MPWFLINMGLVLCLRMTGSFLFWFFILTFFFVIVDARSCNIHTVMMFLCVRFYLFRTFVFIFHIMAGSVFIMPAHIMLMHISFSVSIALMIFTISMPMHVYVHSVVLVVSMVISVFFFVEFRATSRFSFALILFFTTSAYSSSIPIAILIS